MILNTAIIIVPSQEVLAIATPTQQRFAPDSSIRIPPHITVLFPFVSYEHLDAACEGVAHICQKIAPFEITMDGYDSFPKVAFMRPADPRPIQAVFRQIYAAFPQCKPYNGEFGDDLHPHMTVGEFASEAEQTAAELPDYEPITFRAERLHVIYGRWERLPWITRAVIPLKG
jgi:2'-5' RNA ligase